MLTQAVMTYLAVRRATGFALRCESFPLKSFAAFSEAREKRYVSSDIAIEWAGLARSVSQRARRLGTVIRFARYLRAEDEHHEVPPAIFGVEKPPRPTPYILTPEQISQNHRCRLAVGVSNAPSSDLQRAVLLAGVHGATGI